jgi:ferric-dicitrate binding protein FerR (iron transport regulator)
MEERPHADFTVEDFMANDSFLNYHVHNNPEDEIFWEQWLLLHPGKRPVAEEAMATLDTLFLRLSKDEYCIELEKIKMKLGVTAPAEKETPSLIRFLSWNKDHGIKRRNKIKRALVYIAPVLLFLLAGGYFFIQRSSSQQEELYEKNNTGNTAIQFTLSDSTLITLAPKSILRYQKKFGNTDRRVYLHGEATFHVRRDEAHPFKVFSGGLVATVLGTLFIVKEQEGDAVVLVELLEGKVKVETGNTTGSIILNPNEKVVYTRASHNIYKENWQPGNAMPSLQNHIVFRKNNFTEIAVKLKTVFGITVINQSNKNNWRFTGAFDNSNAKDIIENICLIEQLKYEISGDTILIK